MELQAKAEVLLKSSPLKMGGEMEKEYYEVLPCYKELFVVLDMAGEKCGGLSSSSGCCGGLRPA